MYGSELVHFACSHHDILSRAKTRANYTFQNSAFLFSKSSQNRDDFNASSDWPFIGDLIKLKNKKKEQELSWNDDDQNHTAVCNSSL